MHCNSCAAEFTLPPDQETQTCPFCGSHVVVPINNEERIPPNGVLPFVITGARARFAMGEWLGSRFWAPRDLKRMALKEGSLKGIYVPFWTFDSRTITDYTGQRGEHYWVTVTYTAVENGRPVTRTRQERRTRWYPAAGTVHVPFDDVTVQASSAVPSRYAEGFSDWDLPAVVPYNPQYLVGFQTMRYELDLSQGLQIGRDRMQPGIDSAIRYDIGGDEQMILTKNTQYFDNTFKLLLLPIWTGAYRYRGKPFRVLINGRTGDVRGEAPVSFWKVLLAVILGLSVAGGIFYAYQESQRRSQSSSVQTDYVPDYPIR